VGAATVTGEGVGMIARFAVVVATLLAASLACAETLSPDAARRFVAGKLFAFNCFDGSRGAGRIYGDGSVIGTIQFRGAGPVRAVWLPAGGVGRGGGGGGEGGGGVGASQGGGAWERFFHRERPEGRASRGWGGVLPFGDSPRRMNVAGVSTRRHSSQPLSLEAEEAS